MSKPLFEKRSAARLRSKLPMLLVAALGIGATACEAPTSLVVGNSAIDSYDSSQMPDASHAVCNPLGGYSTAGRNQGLIGKLRSLDNGTPATRIEDFYSHGTLADATLFFDQLNVPTRPFDQGFVTQNGTVLKTPSGNTLYEWFQLSFETRVQLSERLDGVGKYQFAVLSDDGSIVRIGDGSGNWKELINADMQTASRLTCATSTVHMDGTTALPMQIDYFQGPRYHIALMLLWRQIPDGADESTALADPACGQAGNDIFFDSTKTPSAAQPAWLGMLQRGWKVVSPENFLLPDSSVINPCSLSGGAAGT